MLVNLNDFRIFEKDGKFFFFCYNVYMSKTRLETELGCTKLSSIKYKNISIKT